MAFGPAYPTGWGGGGSTTAAASPPPVNTTAFQHPGGTGNNYAQWSNPYQDKINAYGAFFSNAATQQNAAIDAQIRAIQGQLLGAGLGGGGGGGGAGAGIANAIAALQNQMHDIDIHSAQSALGQIPGLKSLAARDFNAQQKGLDLQGMLQRLSSQSAHNSFASDATARGARSAPGTANQFTSMAQQLADQLAGIQQNKSSNVASYMKGNAALDTQADSLRGQMAKLAIQKQIENQQAKAAAAGGGGGNPFASLAQFMGQMQASQQIGQLNLQKMGPAQQSQAIANYATTLLRDPQAASLMAMQMGVNPAMLAKWVTGMMAQSGAGAVGSGGKR